MRVELLHRRASLLEWTAHLDPSGSWTLSQRTACRERTLCVFRPLRPRSLSHPTCLVGVLSPAEDSVYGAAPAKRAQRQESDQVRRAGVRRTESRFRSRGVRAPRLGEGTS